MLQPASLEFAGVPRTVAIILYGNEYSNDPENLREMEDLDEPRSAGVKNGEPDG